MAPNQQWVKEAAEWFVRMHDGPPSAATRAQFIEWLLLSPSHLRAFLEVTEAIGSLGAAAKDLDREQLIQSASADPGLSNVVPLDAAASAHIQSQTLKDEQSRTKKWMWMGIAACALGAGVLAGWTACNHWHSVHFAAVERNR
jgi:transmembrane sensor